MEVYPKPLNVKNRELLNSLGKFLGIRIQWKMYLPAGLVEPIKTVRLIGSAPQVLSAQTLLPLSRQGDIDREALIIEIMDMHNDLLSTPRLAMAYRKRMKAIDSFILTSVKLRERRIPGVTDRIILSRAPKTRFKENTLIL